MHEGLYSLEPEAQFTYISTTRLMAGIVHRSTFGFHLTFTTCWNVQPQRLYMPLIRTQMLVDIHADNPKQNRFEVPNHSAFCFYSLVREGVAPLFCGVVDLVVFTSDFFSAEPVLWWKRETATLAYPYANKNILVFTCHICAHMYMDTYMCRCTHKCTCA